MTLPSKCKFCGLQLEAECADDCPQEWIDVLLPSLCCNRCGGYLEWRRRILSSVKRTCQDWAVKGAETRAAEAQAVFARLEKVTRNIVLVMARFHRATVGVYWHRDFVDQLMERPDKSAAIIAAFENECRRAASSSSAQLCT